MTLMTGASVVKKLLVAPESAMAYSACVLELGVGIRGSDVFNIIIFIITTLVPKKSAN